MNTKKTLINVLILLLVGVGLWFAYSYFFQTEEEVGTSVSIQTAGAEDNELTQESEFVILLSRLRNVSLDAAFLGNDVFNSELQNYTSPLPGRDRGRLNPFASFGVGNISSSVATTPNTTIPSELNNSQPSTPTTNDDSSGALSPEDIDKIREALGQ